MHQLSSRERLERCYVHQETDRPGVYVRRGWPKDDPTYERLVRLIDEKTDINLPWSLQTPPGGAQTKSRTEPVSEDWQRQIILMHTPNGILESTRLVSLRHRPGLNETYFIKDERDAEKWLSLPLPQVGGETDSFFKRRESLGDRGILEASIGMNAGGTIAELCGSETFAVLSVTHRDLVHALLERHTGVLEVRLKHMLDTMECPIPPIVVG